MLCENISSFSFMLPLSLKICIFIVIALLILSLLIDALLYILPMNQCIALRMKNTPYQFHYVDFLGQKIRYIEVGNPKKPLLMIVHGSPGSLRGSLHLMNDPVVLQKYRVIAIDRIGFGRSSFGQAEPSISVHGDALCECIGSIVQDDDAPLTLLGHSYGVPIICYAAAKLPKKVKRLICISGAVDPAHERILPVSYPMEWPLLKWIVPRALQVSNVEKLHHVQALKAIDFIWDKIFQKVDIVHATRDWLVPFENVHFMKNKMTNASISVREIDADNHLVFWKRKDVIEEVIFS
jgi:hypothetical protein